MRIWKRWDGISIPDIHSVYTAEGTALAYTLKLMNQEYSDELRNDTTIFIIPLMSIMASMSGILGMVFNMSAGFNQIWPWLMLPIFSLPTAKYSWGFIKKGKQKLGTGLFLSVHMLLIANVFSQTWGTIDPNPFPFLFAIFIIVASMTLKPASGFTVWLASVFLILLSAAFVDSPFWLAVESLLLPIGFNLLVAAAMYFSAMEWQVAVESVSYLHIRAQQRRDELFNVKEEVSASNDRLVYLNQQLDEARQLAVNERDLRTRFMNNVSHELRTPLNAIVNFAHILIQDGAGSINRGQQDYLERIEKSGWHLLDVLNDLLDMAQIESGEFKLYPEVIDLRAVCEEATVAAQGLILGKEGVEFRTDYPNDWPQVRVDHIRIKQALINLLGNAMKYTESGYITLRVRNDETAVSLQVIDTGIGIAPEYHEVIFQEFKQVDETAARKRIGTGLGLPITRHLIERHGGTVHVESQPGKGSTFTIQLPLYQDSAEKPQEITQSLVPNP